MVQGGRRLRLALEMIEPSMVCRDFVRKHFDRQLPQELRVTGAVDLAHAAGADPGNDFVRTESVTWG
jgi:hypothetical protein